ncbi:hypothetical protein GCM10027168_49980 [Streptomyces capparidis]
MSAVVRRPAVSGEGEGWDREPRPTAVTGAMTAKMNSVVKISGAEPTRGGADAE